MNRIKDKKERNLIEEQAATIRLLTDLTEAGSWVINYASDGSLASVKWGDGLRRLMGYTDQRDFPNELESIVRGIYPEDRDVIIGGITTGVFNESIMRTAGYDFRFYKKDGTVRWFRTRGMLTRDSEGRPVQYKGVVIDITNEKMHDALYDELQNEAASLDTIHEMLGSGKWSMDFDEAGVMVQVKWSDEFRRMIGYQGTEDFPDVLESWSDLLHPEDREHVLSEYNETISDYTGQKTYDVEYRLLTKDRGYRWYRAVGKPTRRPDGSPVTYVGVFIDITEQKENAQNLTVARRMADIDSLTGVKNKNAYVQWEIKINNAIDSGEQEPFAVVVCDINDLKKVNDLYGHKEGDACIRKACKKICTVFDHSPVFRIGGDEFVVILSGEDYYNRNKLMEQINAVPGDYSKIKIGDTVSAGMAEYKNNQHLSLLSVLEEADKAMYERKQFLKENTLPKANTADGNPAYEYIPVIHSRKCILIADDIEMNREIIGDLLRDEYDVLYASDGNEALEVLRAHREEIDLLLLDLQMPNRSGREVIAEMQVDEDLMSVPVIVLTVDQQAELDCLKIGAMDFIPKPYPDIEIVKARISKCIELSEDRDLIRYTERDKLTGLLNKDYFFRYVTRLDHLYRNIVMDAIACDINRFHSLNKQYGRQFCDQILRSIGVGIRKLARRTGGIGCREEGDVFLMYCPHQDNYKELLQEFLSEVMTEKEMNGKAVLRFGLFTDAQREHDIEERFIRARTEADRVNDDDPQTRNFCGADTCLTGCGR